MGQKPLKVKRTKTEKKKPEPNTQELWDSYKRHSIQIVGILEGEEREESEEIFETIMTEFSPN